MLRSVPSPSSLLIPLVMLQAQGLYSQAKDVSIAISGNRTITVAMKDGMPLPAEDRNIKIQVAGLGSSPDKADPSKRAIFWIFGFTQKDGPKISEVKMFSNVKAEIVKLIPLISDSIIFPLKNLIIIQ